MDNVGIDLLVIALLLFLNGILAMSETALLSVRKARLQHRVNEGDTRAQTALQLIEHPNRFLSTIQIGITLIDVLVGAIGGAAVATFLGGLISKVSVLEPYSEAISLFFVVIVITYFSIVFGELVPKRIAIQNAERVASVVAGPMLLISKIVSPFVHVLSGSTDLLLRLLGVKQSTEPLVTEEELLVQLAQGTQAGVFEESEQDMVEGVFSLSDQRVNALMTPRNEIIWLDVNDTAAEIRRKVEESPFSRFPVGDDSLDNLVGIVKAKDLLLADLKNGKQLKEIARPPLYVPETAFGSRALEILKEAKREMVLVVDEFGVVQGLLTLADILEEIVGAFEGEPQATQRQDGSWLLDGMLQNDEFKEIFNLRRLPDEEEYETLGGFVMLHMGRIPQAADLFEWNGLRFEVMDMDGKRVDKILVSTIPAKPPAPEK
ncbi:MAG: HlyC/CorC family transporter [Candidatus Atribacteria bacterium]|nr:HlyC/CorC family transporter [Candidatus Atribacteria bacterium]